MRRLKAIFGINPILVKEIRSRMRGPRAFITLTLILVVMGGIMYGMLQLILAGSRYSNVLSPQVGQILFAALAFLELFMISAITPAVTAGAISGEKEKQTYEMLMATPLSPTSILWGKLISAMSYVFLLLFAGIPLASIVFIFGGVAPWDMVKTLIVLVATAVSFGVIGLFLSALFGRTGRATVASFILVVVLMIGPIFMAGLVGVIRSSEPPRWLLVPSPISALSSTLAPTMGMDWGGSLFYILGGVFNIGSAPISQTSIPRPMYHYTIPFYAVLSLILIMLSTRLVQPTRRWRIRRNEALIGLASILVLLGTIAGAYFLTAKRYEWALNDRENIPAVVEPAIARPLPATVSEKRVEVAPVFEVPTPSPFPPRESTVSANSGESIGDEDQVSIYAAIARQLYTKDHTFGDKPPSWTNLYLISMTDDDIGDPDTTRSDPVNFSDEVQASIINELDDLAVEIIWVKTRDEVPTDPQTGLVQDGEGVIFTFGNVHVQDDGTVHVPASLYFSGLGAGGKTYIFQETDGIWSIIGTTCVEWIS